MYGKPTQYQIILKYVRDTGGWVREHHLQSRETPEGFIGARGTRDVRDLIRMGRLEASYEGKYRIVRYIAPKQETAEEREEILLRQATQ